MRDYHDIPLWGKVAEKDWQDWKWHVANRITSLEELKQVIDLTPEEETGVTHCLHNLRMAITPYYATLIDGTNPDCPIRKQAVPTLNELQFSKSDMADPLHEV